MMNPHFDQETETLLTSTLGSRYAGFLEDEVFTAEHERDEDHVTLALRLDRVDGTQRWVWQALLETKAPTDEDPALFLLVDFLDTYLSEFFASERTIRPQMRFVAHRFREVDICLRGRRRNLGAEKEAANYLGEEVEDDFPKDS